VRGLRPRGAPGEQAVGPADAHRVWGGREAVDRLIMIPAPGM
jgi:hypothetical protein